MEINENKSAKKSKDFLILILIIGVIFLFIVGLLGGTIFLYLKYVPKSNSLNNNEKYSQNKQIPQNKENKYVKIQEESFSKNGNNKSISANENEIDKKKNKDNLKNEKIDKTDNIISKAENVEKPLSNEDKINLESLLKETNNSNLETVKSALIKLKKYPNAKDAFEVVKNIIINHKDVRVRVYALTALNVFRTFDLISVYDEILLNLKDEQFGSYFINSVYTSKIEGYEKVLIKALNSNYNDVRYRSLFYLSKLKNPLFVSAFMEKAINEKVWEIRDIALFSLSTIQAKEVLPVLYSLLSSNNNNEKQIGFNYLKMFELTNEIKEKLSEYKNDSVIGKKIIMYLDKK